MTNNEVNEIAKDLNKRFDEFLSNNDLDNFTSVNCKNCAGCVNSSNLYGTLKGPEKFKWIIESKCGYNNIDLSTVLSDGNAELDDWFKQISKNATKYGKLPLLIWKKDYKSRIAFIRQDDFVWLLTTQINPFEYRFEYRDWVGISYDVLMTLEDKVFF